MTDLLPLDRENLPPDFRERAELLDDETILKLVDAMGGEVVYIPKRETIERNARDRAIRKSYYCDLVSGTVLSRRYHLSRRQIQRILSEKNP